MKRKVMRLLVLGDGNILINLENVGKTSLISSMMFDT